MLGQPRFVPCRRILVDQALIDRFVDQGNCRKKEFGASGFITARNGCSQFLDRCSKFAAVAAIDLFAFCVLPHPLFC